MYPWFKLRRYKHFDVPVGLPFADKACRPEFVAQHSWCPLLSCRRSTKRYKPKLGKTVMKHRPIAYASHKDSCILAKYADDLAHRLDVLYEETGLTSSVLAYRKLGFSNFDFAASAQRFARERSPCVVLCFDVSGFFDNLDHRLLKAQLATLLRCDELPPDWYGVFRAVTKYRHIPLSVLKAHPLFAQRLRGAKRRPIATMAELKSAKVDIQKNLNHYGVPQGTPISAVLSNLYMLDLDTRMVSACSASSSLYQRYSDDILLICKPENEAALVETLRCELDLLKLELNDSKLERVEFGSARRALFQYLGFEMSLDDAHIRGSSLSRQWRKAKRALRKTARIGGEAVAAGRSEKIYTRKLRKRFAALPVRNFSLYARRAAKAFGSKTILRQVRKLERTVDAEIRKLNGSP